MIRLLSIFLRRRTLRFRHEMTMPEGSNLELTVRPRKVVIPSSGITVFESRHAPGFARSVLCDPFSKFLLLIAGKATVRVRDRAFHLSSESLLHVCSGTTHCYEEKEEDPVTLFALCYRDDLLPADLRSALGRDPVRHWNLGRADAPLARPFRSSFREMLYEQTMQFTGWPALMQSLLIQICVRAARLELRENACVFDRVEESLQRVAQYLARMETQFFRPQSLDEAAASAGVSRRRFTALFRKAAGRSWHRHLEELRIRHATRLLRETDRSVLSIAFESGFETATSFYRAFKRILRESPQAYRRRNRTV